MNSWNRYAYRYISSAALIVLLGGTIFYHVVERFTWVNAYYCCVATLATVGYGDIVPHTDFGKIFTTFYIMIGVGIFTAFITTAINRRGQKLKQRLNLNEDGSSRDDNHS